MTRTLLILAILTLDYFNVSAQTKAFKFDRMIISHNGDSLLKREYALNIKNKKVYFMTPVASHLHIKGEKYRTRVKYKKADRKKIFNLIDQLTWTNLAQMDDKGIKNKYFIVRTFSADTLIGSFKVSDDLLPTDFKNLYNALSGR
jgi:hypothetical protein